MIRSCRLLPLLAAAVLAACDGLPTGGSDGIRIDSIEDFASGQSARLVGTNLDRINSLILEGQSVTLAAGSPTERPFIAPQLRACETDGRKVEAIANGGTKLSPSLHVAGVLRMEVGESRVIDLASLPACLQLPASDQDFVLTALNPSLVIETPAVAKALVELRSWTESAVAPSNARMSAARASVSSRDPHLEAEHAARAALLASADGYYSDNPVPFDPNYATAKVGDTVHFVDWTAASSSFCFAPRSQAPSYPVKVIAVSGNLVIGVDLRLPNAQAVQQQAAGIQMAADIAAPLLLPTMREIFEPQFEHLRGGGGRVYAIVSELPNGVVGLSSDGRTSGSQQSCPLASEMVTVLIGNYAGAWSPSNAASAASTIIHEVAHNADLITGLRRHGPYQPFPVATGWGIEAVAVNAQEAAARIALGRSENAPRWNMPDSAPHPAPLFGSVWGTAPEESPWSADRGNYDVRGSLLLYLREREGDADIGDARSPLYLAVSDRLVGAMWTFERWADVFETDPTTLLDEWSLAHATDDIVDPAKADARKLPRFKTWDNTGRQGPTISQRSLSRSTNHRTTLSAGNGNYAAAYMVAEATSGTSAHRGISVELTSPSGAPAVLRITRLR